MTSLRLRVYWLPTLLLLMGFAAVASSSPNDSSQPFHSNTAAGYEVLELAPSGATVSLFGLIECPELEGAQHREEGTHASVVDSSGTTVTRFPRHFSFRVTGTLRRTIRDNPSYSLPTTEDPQQFLLKLGFRLKIYDGLNVHELQPESVELIGVPADIAYDERVYRVNFDIGDRPVTNRVVLEVLSPEGERLTRFHFELL